MFRLLAAVAVLGIATACANDTGEQTELTRAQKDSIVADLPIPGASGVGNAMQARDRANTRAAAHDELASQSH